jgi:hypothetical protein
MLQPRSYRIVGNRVQGDTIMPGRSLIAKLLHPLRLLPPRAAHVEKQDIMEPIRKRRVTTTLRRAGSL